MRTLTLIKKPLGWLMMLQLFLLQSLDVLAQDDKGVHVDIGTGSGDHGGGAFYTAWWFWLIVVLLFVIIIVAITSGRKKS
jgi:hypothetical protein